jgi:apolipoprotein N-acyltransferase
MLDSLLMPRFWTRCLMSLLSALLLNLPFPIAGPVSPWRTAFAFLGAVPLLYALLARQIVHHEHYLLKGFLTGWVTGIVWYGFNCYWIYQTMYIYGGLPSGVAVGILILYSLILGLYFGLFGWMVSVVRHSFGSRIALLAVPFLWVATDLLASLVTKVPWDQLGYSQVGNFQLTRIAPYTGVYGITFILLYVNVLLVSAFISVRARWRIGIFIIWLFVAVTLLWGYGRAPAPAPTQATAVLLQENLSVTHSNQWSGADWDQNVAMYLDASQRSCGPYIAGMPETSAVWVQPDCPAVPASPDMIAWPEAPSPFHEGDPRFHEVAKSLTAITRSPAIIGNLAIDFNPQAPITRNAVSLYNAASFIAPDGSFVGRYNKVHLVPWGEYVPFKSFFAFAGHLTHQVGDMTHGWRRDLFSINGHHFGVFICYESIFGDEIRIFAKEGADVFVNISDDGWYGDTSAPWQHLNMVRMRAIENRRWVLRDTNTGVTTVIDPYGRLTASVPRHIFTSLAARYGYRTDRTFYTMYGNVFAWLCGIITMVALIVAAGFASRHRAV